MSAEHWLSHLAEDICICTANHDPITRIECRYALDAARKVLAAGWRPTAAVCEAEQRAWDQGVDAGHRAGVNLQPSTAAKRRNPYRADRIAEPASHEAATNGKEA